MKTKIQAKFFLYPLAAALLAAIAAYLIAPLKNWKAKTIIAIIDKNDICTYYQKDIKTGKYDGVTVDETYLSYCRAYWKYIFTNSALKRETFDKEENVKGYVVDYTTKYLYGVDNNNIQPIMEV